MRESILNPCARVRYASRGRAIATAMLERPSTARFRFFRRRLGSRLLLLRGLFCGCRVWSWHGNLCGSGLAGLGFATRRWCGDCARLGLALVFALGLFLFFLLRLVFDSG